MPDSLSYARTGVDIDATDAAKRRMAAAIDRGDPRVLNRLGAFASLVEARFPGYSDPVLVLKTDEPGSKQMLAFAHDRIEGLCQDLVHHLLNDVAVMGAEPLYVLDCIVGGRLDDEVVGRLVRGMADACAAQGCALVGGETSIQPGVLAPGVYVLSATAVGVVERSAVVDGARIAPGDAVLAVASNGLHTNGYTMVRALLERDPALADAPVDGEPFFEAVMRPHRCYVQGLRGLAGHAALKGVAHITGGGIRDNLVRILPPHVEARTDLSALRVPAVFGLIRQQGRVSDADMLRTFNLGCGLIVVCAADGLAAIGEHLAARGFESWPIGRIDEGRGEVAFDGSVDWP